MLPPSTLFLRCYGKKKKKNEPAHLPTIDTIDPTIALFKNPSPNEGQANPRSIVASIPTAEATILAHNRGSSDLEIITPPLNGVINAKLVYRTTWPPLHSLGYKNSSSSLRHLSPGRWDLPARSRRVDRFLDAPRIRLAASVASPHDRFRVTAGRMVVSPGCVGVFQPGERA